MFSGTIERLALNDLISSSLLLITDRASQACCASPHRQLQSHTGCGRSLMDPVYWSRKNGWVSPIKCPKACLLVRFPLCSLMSCGSTVLPNVTERKTFGDYTFCHDGEEKPATWCKTKFHMAAVKSLHTQVTFKQPPVLVTAKSSAHDLSFYHLNFPHWCSLLWLTAGLESYSYLNWAAAASWYPWQWSLLFPLFSHVFCCHRNLADCFFAKTASY